MRQTHSESIDPPPIFNTQFFFKKPPYLIQPDIFLFLFIFFSFFNTQHLACYLSPIIQTVISRNNIQCRYIFFNLYCHTKLFKEIISRIFFSILQVSSSDNNLLYLFSQKEKASYIHYFQKESNLDDRTERNVVDNLDQIQY